MFYWLDGYDRSGVTVSDSGERGCVFWLGNCVKCWPRFANPYFQESGGTAYWIQKTYKATINLNTDACTMATVPSSENRQGHTCPSPGTCRGSATFNSSSGCIPGFVAVGGFCGR